MAEHTSTADTRGRSSDEIRRDIERKRSEMDETVHALEDRLSPGKVLDEVWTRMRSGEGGGVGDVIKDHPVPLALMGLGLGWLAVESASGKSATPSGPTRAHHPGTEAPAAGRVGPYRGDAVSDDADWAHAGTGTKVKAKASDAADKVKGAVGSAADKLRSAGDKAADMKDRAGEKAGDLKERATDRAHVAQARTSATADDLQDTASERASRAADAASRQARRARSGFFDMLEENPLALGAVAFGLGLASGISVPTTDAEDRLMGRTSDTLKSEAKRTARDTAESAKRVAKETAEAAKDEAENQSDRLEASLSETGSEVKDAAKQVAQTAKETAERKAEEEDLTAEEAKRRASKAGERTKQTAKSEADRRA